MGPVAERVVAMNCPAILFAAAEEQRRTIAPTQPSTNRSPGIQPGRGYPAAASGHARPPRSPALAELAAPATLTRYPAHETAAGCVHVPAGKRGGDMIEINSTRGSLGFVTGLALITGTCAPAGTVETAPDSRSGQQLAISGSTAALEQQAQQSAAHQHSPWLVDFGDDTSSWARDDECDDPRFEGSYMNGTLLEEDRGHDATDCRRLYEAGLIRLFGVDLVAGHVFFGDDSSEYAQDGECDDIRFSGNGMGYILVEEHRGRDATDCRRLYEAGRIRLFGLQGPGLR